MRRLCGRDHGDEVVPSPLPRPACAAWSLAVQSVGLHPPAVDVGGWWWCPANSAVVAMVSGRIRDVVHVHVDAVQSAPRRPPMKSSPQVMRAPIFQYVGEGYPLMLCLMPVTRTLPLMAPAARKQRALSASLPPGKCARRPADIGLVALDVEHLVVVVLDDTPNCFRCAG